MKVVINTDIKFSDTEKIFKTVQKRYSGILKYDVHKRIMTSEKVPDIEIELTEEGVDGCPFAYIRYEDEKRRYKYPGTTKYNVRAVFKELYRHLQESRVRIDLQAIYEIINEIAPTGVKDI